MDMNTTLIIVFGFALSFLVFLWRAFSMFRQVKGKLDEAGVTPQDIARQIHEQRNRG